MGSFLKKYSLFSLVLFTAFIYVLVSCSQVTPELTEANYSVIFEYEDNEKLPESRLSFFMESKSDVQRYDRIKITALENGYIWDFNEISKIVLSENKWAGNTNLVVPDNQVIPSGKYEVTYYNADEKETTVYVTVSYDTSIYDMTAEALEEKMKAEGATSKIAIYDAEDVLLYYGEKTYDLSSIRGIWNEYRYASYFYDIWCTSGDYVICIMPKQNVTLDNE